MFSPTTHTVRIIAYSQSTSFSCDLSCSNLAFSVSASRLRASIESMSHSTRSSSVAMLDRLTTKRPERIFGPQSIFFMRGGTTHHIFYIIPARWYHWLNLILMVFRGIANFNVVLSSQVINSKQPKIGLTQESLRMVTARVLVVLSGSFTSQIETGPTLT